MIAGEPESGMTYQPSAEVARKNTRIAFAALGAVALMVGMAFAAVPLYEVFCRVTGYGGTTQVADGTDVTVVDRDIRVRFTGNLHTDMLWNFRPKQPRQDLKVGEQAMAFYEACNPANRAITGTATFNVTPFKAGVYFSKIECFCFTEQTLAPGERVDMPVVYYIDPAFADDPDMSDVQEITLSYTFFEREPSNPRKEGGDSGR